MSRKYLDFITHVFCNMSQFGFTLLIFCSMFSGHLLSFYLDLLLFTFLLLRQKKSNKRKGDFIPNAPQE